ncbi:MAG: hypothetical protein HZY76_09980 [Anaerolineae bacterium]|nr:MAG: hypothetical protein HZY76_09980 [Anaerolineae bacterium]
MTNPNNPNHPDVGCGSLDWSRTSANCQPSSARPVHRPQPAVELLVWLAAMAAQVQFVDVQDGWLCQIDPNTHACLPNSNHFNAVQTPVPGVAEGFPVDFGNWLERQSGSTAADSDQLWVALRETEYPATGDVSGLTPNCNGFCHGWLGNFEHF